MTRWRKILLFPLTRVVLGVLLLGAGSWLAQRVNAWFHYAPKDLSAGAMVAVALVPLLVLLFLGRVVERKSLAEIGLAWAGAAPRIGLGFLVGAGMMLFTTALFFLAGWYHVKGLAPLPAGHHHTLELLFSVWLFFLVGVNEELAFRGVLFRPIEDGLGSILAVVITGALFGAAHLGNPNATWVSAVAIALEAGVMLGAAYIATRSLWFVIGIHWAWNLFEGPVLGYAVSGFHPYQLLETTVQGPVKWTGGEFGPEAGGVTMILGVVIGGYFWWLAARRKEVRGFAYWLREIRAAEAAAGAERSQGAAPPATEGSAGLPVQSE